MSDGPQDAELSAMARCVRALEPLDRHRMTQHLRTNPPRKEMQR